MREAKERHLAPHVRKWVTILSPCVKRGPVSIVWRVKFGPAGIMKTRPAPLGNRAREWESAARRLYGMRIVCSIGAVSPEALRLLMRIATVVARGRPPIVHWRSLKRPTSVVSELPPATRHCTR